MKRRIDTGWTFFLVPVKVKKLLNISENNENNRIFNMLGTCLTPCMKHQMRKNVHNHQKIFSKSETLYFNVQTQKITFSKLK